MESVNRVRKILGDLNYDFRQFSIEHFIHWVENQKQCQIKLIPWLMPSGLFGAWMTDGDELIEYIFYRNDGPQIHQIHIQLHELAHFLCGHPTAVITRKDLQSYKAGYLDLPFTELTQLRSPKLDLFEFEAEFLASLIQEQAIHHSRLQKLIGGISSDQKLADQLKDLGLV
jgi:hypothetical protein